MDKEAPIVVATTWMTSEASVIKSLLEGYGIPCHYSFEIPQPISPLPTDGITEICIYVPAALAVEARRLLEEHRRQGNLHLVDN